MFATTVKGKVKLKEIPTREDGGLSKEEGIARTAELGAELEGLLDALYAARTHGLLVVLQGRDTAGKDGAIRTILRSTNVQSMRVAGFKAPSAEEAAHDFLWRIHRQTPEKGEVVLFNRSHYEDVIAVRVHELAPEAVWRPRFAAIRQFEETLAREGTIVVKFFLHLSPDEQEERLLAREAEPEKAWKLSVGDWAERPFWDATTEAYEEAIRETTTETAPWRIVPADRKWFRDLAILEAIVATLRPHREGWRSALAERGAEAMREITAYRSDRG